MQHAGFPLAERSRMVARAHATATYEHELLAAEISRKRMLPYKARIRARRFEDFVDWVRHDGEEFMLVLSGEVELITEFYESVAMGPGARAVVDFGNAAPREPRSPAARRYSRESWHDLPIR